MKEQELSSNILYFNGNSKYQKKPHAQVREKKLYCQYKEWHFINI